MLDPSLAPVVRVTLGFVSLYFAFIAFQSFSKFYLHAKLKAEAKKKGEKPAAFSAIKYGSKGGRLGLCGDRTVGNTIEQALVFLPLLWLSAHSSLGPEQTAFWGWTWLASRAIYPFMFYRGIPFIFISTVPGYVVIARLFAACVGLC